MRDLALRVPPHLRRSVTYAMTALIGFVCGCYVGWLLPVPLGFVIAAVLGLPIGYVGSLISSRWERMEDTDATA